jgi:hypothetical protein
MGLNQGRLSARAWGPVQAQQHAPDVDKMFIDLNVRRNRWNAKRQGDSFIAHPRTVPFTRCT